jgi:hypothetical protein
VRLEDCRGRFLVAWGVRVRLDFSMAFFTNKVSDSRVQIWEGILYFDGSTNQLIALIIQDVVDAVQRKRLEDLGKG